MLVWVLTVLALLAFCVLIWQMTKSMWRWKPCQHCWQRSSRINIVFSSGSLRSERKTNSATFLCFVSWLMLQFLSDSYLRAFIMNKLLRVGLLDRYFECLDGNKYFVCVRAAAFKFCSFQSNRVLFWRLCFFDFCCLWPRDLYASDWVFFAYSCNCFCSN